jgi:hypothetical protein
MSRRKADPVDLRTLRMSRRYDFNKLISDLISDDKLDEDALSIVRERLEGGEEIFSGNLAKLVALTGDELFYDHIKSIKNLGTDDLLVLYRSQYPDPAIENILLDLLYQFSDQDAQPWRRYIAEAIRDVGSTACLDVLTRIRSELEQRVKVGKSFINTFDVLERIKMKSSISFFELIDEAIESVRERGVQMAEFATEREGDLPAPSSLPSRVYERLAEARKFQVDHPTISLSRLRVGAEAIALTVCQKMAIKNGKTGKKPLLSDYIAAMKSDNRRIPDLIFKLLESIQAFGNAGSHDEGDEVYLVNEQIAAAVIVLYENLVEICESWLPTQDS